MSSSRDTSSSPQAKCDACGRIVALVREADGFGRPREDRSYRYTQHSGNRWGRPCRNSGEQHVGAQP